MRVFHATRALAAVQADGWVRPTRMDHVYAFTTREAAEEYAFEFGYEAVIEVDVEPATIVRRWKPRYASGAEVLKLKGAAKVVPA